MLLNELLQALKIKHLIQPVLQAGQGGYLADGQQDAINIRLDAA